MQMVSALAQSLEQSPFVYDELRIEMSSGKYVVTLAQTPEEIDAALKLRFEVFNLELGEGLDSSFRTGRDRDQFDAICSHLVVTDQTNGNVVGTYRLRTIEMAESAEGFYSAGEFDLNHLPQGVLNQSVELGRACIAQSHRNRQVLFLLWKALARYVQARRKRFLFGCCSLTSQEPNEGNQLLGHLTRGGHMHQTLFVPPQAGYECKTDYSGSGPSGEVRIPQLFGMYLSMGAKVCSPPAIDGLFKTIDFLVLFDVEAMDSRTRNIFFAR
ncbi:MAG TPA: GNAT family N-acyltransferase [Pyrinomonadaceae bacterium]|nr:GNAT family N-acyltransferase [Pyrinomonadaceae bacterium]